MRSVQICRYAAPKRVEWFVNSAVEMYKGGSGAAESGSGDRDARCGPGSRLPVWSPWLLQELLPAYATSLHPCDLIRVT